VIYQESHDEAGNSRPSSGGARGFTFFIVVFSRKESGAADVASVICEISSIREPLTERDPKTGMHETLSYRAAMILNCERIINQYNMQSAVCLPLKNIK
jgi:hypothetical protein